MTSTSRTRPPRAVAVFTVISGLWIAPALSHHSFTVAFDVERFVSVEGVVTAVKWENPHTWIYLDARGADGQVEEWQFESLPPNPLRRQGVTPAILKPGVTVTLRGYAAHDRSQTIAAASTIEFGDGAPIRISAGGTPPPPGE